MLRLGHHRFVRTLPTWARVRLTYCELSWCDPCCALRARGHRHDRAGSREQATSTGAPLDGMSRDRPTELSKPSLLTVLKRAVAGMTHFFRIRLCSLGRLGGRGVARRSGDGGG